MAHTHLFLLTSRVSSTTDMCTHTHTQYERGSAFFWHSNTLRAHANASELTTFRSLYNSIFTPRSTLLQSALLLQLEKLGLPPLHLAYLAACLMHLQLERHSQAEAGRRAEAAIQELRWDFFGGEKRGKLS